LAAKLVFVFFSAFFDVVVILIAKPTEGWMREAVERASFYE